MIRSIFSAIAGLFSHPGMDDRSLRAWRQARTLDDLGGCMAGWLSGAIPARPGVAGRPEVDEDLVRGLTDTLIACCNAGYVVDSSQAGVRGSSRLTVAALVGFCDQQSMEGLVELGRREILSVIATRAPSSSWLLHHDMAAFNPRAIGDLADSWTGFGVCHPDAAQAVADAWQVEVCDPVPGRNDRLWPALRRWAEERQARRVPPTGQPFPSAAREVHDV